MGKMSPFLGFAAAAMIAAPIGASGPAVRPRPVRKGSHREQHKCEREIARRLRQAARDDQRQRERAANSFAAQVEGAERMSRRGRLIR
jgi:hypothetical protein